MCVVQEQDGGKISILFEHGTNWDSNRPFPHFMVAGLLHMFICYVLSVVISQTKPHVFFFRLLRTGVNKVGAGKTGLRGFGAETWKKMERDFSYIGLGMETIGR
jgi:hypothetical protein